MQFQRLLVFPRTGPDEFLPGLPAATKDQALQLAYRVAGQPSARTFASELEASLAAILGSDLLGVQLVLPSDDDEPWAVPNVVGTGDTALTIESLGIGRGELNVMLRHSEVVVCTLKESELVLVPYAAGTRVRALIALCVRGDVANAMMKVEDFLIAARPLVESFVTRFARIAEVAAIEEENRYFKDRQRRHYLFKELASESVSMRRLHRDLSGLVSSTAPVLLAGEAGTGKELLARALHHLGPRAGGILVPQHCSALEEDALDFELFGYARRGDGTAVASRRGVFELADGGTVFLDEIHALSPRLQMKMHRMLVEGEVFRIGESFARSVDLRIVASTHLDLMQLADEGKFRRDLAILFTRHVLDVPPLRDRREDIAPLVRTFVAKWARRYRKSVENVDPETLGWLQRLRWPGNVRELLTVIERAVLTADPDQLTLRREDFELK
ncbi:MAG: transcriptional regulator with GAF, ATPase, and Fis domain [Bradymonadia bacterium]